MQEAALVSASGLVRHDGEQVVSFRIGGETMAVGVELVSEIVRLRDITEVPQVPRFVQGVMNLRGRIIPVINLRSRLGMTLGEATQHTRIVVVEISGDSIGMVVDSVDEVMTLAQEDISPPSPVVVSIETDFVRGIARREGELIVLLDVERITAQSESAAVPAGQAALAAGAEEQASLPAGEAGGGAE
jgi:purine-binding chemotaxis protein CheW